MAWTLLNLSVWVLLAVVVWLVGGVFAPLWRAGGTKGIASTSLGGLARWCSGLAYLTMGLFVLSVVGRLDPVGLAVLLLVPGGIWLWQRRTAPRALEGDDAPDEEGSPAWLFLALAALLAPVLALALTPSISWDASTYHLTLPRLYLEHGGFRPVELNVYSHWPQGAELLFALAMLVRNAVTAKLVHFGFGLLVLWTLVAACRSFLPTEQRLWASALALFAFLANGVVLFELRVAYVDLAHAFYFTLALLFLSSWLGSDTKAGPSGDPRLLLMAGIAAGLAAGTKLNGIAGVLLLGLVALPTLLRDHRARPRFAGLFVLPATLLWLPWPIRSAVATGNPFYPLLHGTFGGPDWDAGLAEQLASWQRSIGMGREPLDLLLLPWRVLTEGGRGYERFDGTLSPLWLVLLPAAFWHARRHVFVRRMLAAGGLYFVFWAATSQQMRLLIPALPALALAAGAGNAAWLARLAPGKRRAVGAVLLGLALVAVAWRIPWQGGLSAASRLATLSGDGMESATPPVFAFVDERLPEGSRLLFLNTNQGFFCSREFLADSFFEASQVARWLAPAGADPEALDRLLAERGISHLLLDQRPLAIPYPPALAVYLRDPRHIRPLYQSPDGRYVLFERLGNDGATSGPGVTGQVSAPGGTTTSRFARSTGDEHGA